MFVATPHQGSALAGRAVGQVAGALVSESEPAYEQLRRDNIDVLNESVSRRMPTSIDLLDPTQPFLETIGGLRVSQCVTLHSIIGDGGHAVSLGKSDGIVTVESARHPGVASELYVPASHSGILRHPATVEEIKRILRLHAAAQPTVTAWSPDHATLPDGRRPAIPILFMRHAAASFVVMSLRDMKHLRCLSPCLPASPAPCLCTGG